MELTASVVSYGGKLLDVNLNHKFTRIMANAKPQICTWILVQCHHDKIK
jgi:hypothetical protein